MRPERLLAAAGLALAAGCGGDTNFQNLGTTASTVIGEGDLELGTDRLVFDDLEVGLTYEQALPLSSVGKVEVVVYEARLADTGGGTFYISDKWEDGTTIPVGSTVELLVTATLQEAAPATGTLHLSTNDVDQREYDVPLEAWPASPDTGADTGAGGIP